MRYVFPNDPFLVALEDELAVAYKEMVPSSGLEPEHLSITDFESVASTIPPGGLGGRDYQKPRPKAIKK